MKRLIIMILTAMLLSAHAKAVELPRDLTDALPDAAEELLREFDLSGTDGFLQGLGRIAEQTKEQFGEFLRQRTRGAAAVLLVAVL